MFQPLMEMNCVEKAFKAKSEARFPSAASPSAGPPT